MKEPQSEALVIALAKRFQCETFDEDAFPPTRVLLPSLSEDRRWKMMLS